MTKLTTGSKLGEWTLVKRLGEGGNGVVWECHRNDGTPAAIKVLKTYLLESTSNSNEQRRRSKRARRFIDEIQFLRSHDIKGIISLLDSYLPNDPTTTDTPWLAMPLGKSLPAYLQENGRIFTEVVRIFRDLAATLSVIHAEGSAHRDIKPENIVVVDNTPYLSDFGLVQFDGKDPNTSESEILGPLFFVAPEMMGCANEIDARPADNYSFAKTFWVAATGQQFPLPGEQRLGIPALSLSAYVEDQRAYLLDKLIDTCTRHDPQERPSADQICEELNAWGSYDTTPPETMRAVTEIARSLNSTVAKTRSEFNLRKQMCSWGMELMKAAASNFVPLVDALNSFGFTDQEGYPLPARLIEGEGNPIWDQWTYPEVLVDESGDIVWRGAAGTIAQFVQSRGPSALLVSGVRIIVRSDQSVTFCAAHVSIAAGGIKDHQIIWRADAKSQIGSATADSTLRSLVSQLLGNAPLGVVVFKSMIQRVIAARNV
jgi:serine/threonine protein kinase